MADRVSHRGPAKGPEAPEKLSHNPGTRKRSTACERGRDGWPPGKQQGPAPQPGPAAPPPSSPNDTSIIAGRGDVVDLAAWRRLRRAPAGGQWWGGRCMWTWTAAAESCRRWSA